MKRSPKKQGYISIRRTRQRRESTSVRIERVVQRQWLNIPQSDIFSCRHQARHTCPRHHDRSQQLFHSAHKHHSMTTVTKQRLNKPSCTYEWSEMCMRVRHSVSSLRPRITCLCLRPRQDRGISNSRWGETKTKAFRARDRDKAEAFVCGTMLRVATVAWFFPLNYGCDIFVHWVVSLSKRHERLKAVFKVVLLNTHLDFERCECS